MAKTRTIRPLKAEKPKAPARKPGSPREEWVLEAPEGYVLRRFVPLSERGQFSSEALSPAGWWESSVTSREVVVAGASRLHPSYLIYAVRIEPVTGERHSALVRRDVLLGG